MPSRIFEKFNNSDLRIHRTLAAILVEFLGLTLPRLVAYVVFFWTTLLESRI